MLAAFVAFVDVRLCGHWRIRQPSPLLAMPFVRFQAKGLVFVQARRLAILGVATIALEHIAHDQVQHDVEQRSGEKERKRSVPVVKVPRHAACGQSDRHNGNPQPLWKILTQKELLAWANEASFKPCRADRTGRNGYVTVTMTAR